MAWYALYKWFRPWRKKSYSNWVSWYKVQLYNTWFNGLTDEEKSTELKRVEQLKLKKQRESERYFEGLNRMFGMLNSSSNGKLTDYMQLANDMNKARTGSSKYW